MNNKQKKVIAKLILRGRLQKMIMFPKIEQVEQTLVPQILLGKIFPETLLLTLTKKKYVWGSNPVLFNVMHFTGH